MNTESFDTVTRLAAEGISRRRSLITLGSAAIVATVTRPSASEAKKKGPDCKKKEKQRCASDAAACRATLAPFCAGDPTTCIILGACCDTCSSNGFLTCLIAATPA